MNKKLRARYLHSVALFLGVLVVMLPFYTSSVFAALNRDDMQLGRGLRDITGMDVADTPVEELDAGQACIDKNKKTHWLVEALDNDVVKVLEQIASIMYAISAVWAAVKAVLNTVILILYTLQFTRAAARAQEIYRNIIDHPLIGGLMKFITGAIGCTWASWCNFEISGFSVTVGPYDNIYSAVGCLCPVAILFNMRKLKTIYQVYNCCVEEACKNGISTEPCEKQLSEATCMYWGKGAIAALLVKIIIAGVVGLIMKHLIERFLQQLPPYAGTLFSMAELLAFDWPALQEALNWMGKTFSEPTCEDLGFDELKEEMKRQYVYHKIPPSQLKQNRKEIGGEEYIIFDVEKNGNKKQYAVRTSTKKIYDYNDGARGGEYKGEEDISDSVWVEANIQLGNFRKYGDYVIINEEVYQAKEGGGIEATPIEDENLKTNILFDSGVIQQVSIDDKKYFVNQLTGEVKEYDRDKVVHNNQIETKALIEAGYYTELEIEGRHYVSYMENGQIKFKEYNKESGTLKEVTEPNLLKKLRAEQSIQELAYEAAYSAASNLLKMYLGQFAYDEVAKLCKEEWEASEPVADEPEDINPGPPLESAEQMNCPEELTTLSAQGAKTGTAPNYQYDLTWTIAACKEDIQFEVYLTNNYGKVMLASGVASKGEIKAGEKIYSLTTNYEEICIEVSDASVGTNCFDIVRYGEAEATGTTLLTATVAVNNSAPSTGEDVEFTAVCEDSGGIDELYFAHNISGTMENVTHKTFAGQSSADVTVKITNTVPADTVVGGVVTCIGMSSNSAQAEETYTSAQA
jgi:hypothetical protein